MINLILFGPPGSGKGTQGKFIQQRYKLSTISMGDILRNEIALGTDLGITAKSYMDKGNLVPDEVVVGIIEHTMEQKKDCSGFLFDGFPRTVAQAKALDTMMHHHGIQVSALLELDVPEEELVKRLLLRKEIEGRSDDNIDTINNRLTVYRTQTAPIADYYRKQGLHHLIQGTGKVEEITERLYNAIDKL